MHIIAEIPADTILGKAAISLIDNGTCDHLSIGYPLERNPVTKEVSHRGVDEISFVDIPHFRGCNVSVKANRKNREAPDPMAPYSFYRKVQAGKR